MKQFSLLLSYFSSNEQKFLQSNKTPQMYPPPYISHSRPYEFSHRPFASDFPSRLPPYIPYDFATYPPYYSRWDHSYFQNPFPTRPYDSYWNRGYEVPRPYLPPPPLAYEHAYSFRRPMAGGYLPDRVPLMRPPIMRPPVIEPPFMGPARRMRPPIFDDFREGERYMEPNIRGSAGPLAREPMNLRGFEGNLARSYMVDQEPLARSYYYGEERRQEKKKVRDDNNFEISKEFSAKKAEKREKQQQKKPENQRKQQPPAEFQQQFVSQQPNIPMNIRKI